MKKIVLLSVLLFSAISYKANAQQYYAKPFITQLEEGVKMLKGNPANPKDTTMTGKKLMEVYQLSRALYDNMVNQVFTGVFPETIDSFKISQNNVPYKGLGLGYVRTYIHSGSSQQLTIELATDTSQFYTMRYYMNNKSTIEKNNPKTKIDVVKINDKYNGFVYTVDNYSFIQLMLDNGYIKVTTVDVKKADKVIKNMTPDGYKKFFKKYDLDKANKAIKL